MKREKKKRGILHSRFYQIYFCLVLLALVAIGFGLTRLNDELKDYESAEPVYVAEEVARLFEDGDFDAIYELDSAAEEFSGGDRDFYLKSMHSIADGASVSWSEERASVNEHRYGVTVDGVKFATFTLVPGDETTKLGNRLWKLDSVTTHVTLKEAEPEYVFRITAPSDSVVTVDGRALGSEDRTGKTREIFPRDFLPEGLTAPELVEYSVSVGTETPEISAVDRDGNPQTLEADANDSHALSCGLTYNQDMQARFAKNVMNVAQQLAKYTSEDLGKYSMKKLCIDKSPAYNLVDSFDNQWAPHHSKVEFNNMVVDQFYQHSPDCITCRVSFEYVLIASAKEKKAYQTSYLFCFARDGRKPKLYNMLLN